MIDYTTNYLVELLDVGNRLGTDGRGITVAPQQFQVVDLLQAGKRELGHKDEGCKR